MKRLLSILPVFLLLAACVDTTGISAATSKEPRGNLNSSVIVTEYGDFQCPACIVANDLITKPLFQKYASRVRFEFKQFPLLTIHEFSMPLAQASECAADQGKFWEFVDMAYGEQLKMGKANPPQTFQASDIAVWATNLGLNKDLFDRCTSSGIKQKAIMADFDAGRSIGINGTPTFLVNDQKIEKNDLALISAALDTALKTAPAKAPVKL